MAVNLEDRIPKSNPGAPVLQKNLGDHTLTVYGPHHGAPVDEYQTRPGEEGQGPLLEQGVVPATGSDEHEWVHTHRGEPVNGGKARSAPEAMAAAERSHADLSGGWDPDADEFDPRRFAQYWTRKSIIDFTPDTNEDNWDRWNQHALHPTEEHEVQRHQHEPVLAMRKQAWMGWGPDLATPAARKVAGWDWDDHLLAYTASRPEDFECHCGSRHQVPGYSPCKCGKIWNSYVIGTGGDRHQASAEKYLVREIPSRPDVIVANRQLEREALNLDDLVPQYDLEDEVEDNTPWPTDHHPEQGNATMRAQPEDWHHRERGKFTPGHKPGPGVFKKQSG